MKDQGGKIWGERRHSIYQTKREGGGEGKKYIYAYLFDKKVPPIGGEQFPTGLGKGGGEGKGRTKFCTGTRDCHRIQLSHLKEKGGVT